MRSSCVSSPEVNTEVNSSDDLAGRVVLNPLSDKYYIVLADSTEGYYIVKCLSVNQTKFMGVYLSPVPSEDKDNSLFKETREKDTFLFETLLGEMSTAEKITVNKSQCISIKKVELSDYMLTISDIENK